MNTHASRMVRLAIPPYPTTIRHALIQIGTKSGGIAMVEMVRSGPQFIILIIVYRLALN